MSSAIRLVPYGKDLSVPHPLTLLNLEDESEYDVDTVIQAEEQNDRTFKADFSSMNFII